jgi:hypothetical protein
MLYKEIIAVYSENNTGPTNTKRAFIDCESRWYILLLQGCKGLNLKFLFECVMLRYHLGGWSGREYKSCPATTMQATRWRGVYSALFLTSALDGGEWSALRLATS